MPWLPLPPPLAHAHSPLQGHGSIKTSKALVNERRQAAWDKQDPAKMFATCRRPASTSAASVASDGDTLPSYPSAAQLHSITRDSVSISAVAVWCPLSSFCVAPLNLSETVSQVLPGTVCLVSACSNLRQA